MPKVFVFIYLSLFISTLQAFERRDLNLSWQFQAGEKPTGEWENVSLPHSYKLTSLNLDDSSDTNMQETFHRDICWYQRNLKVSFTRGQKVFLEFEGAHQVTDLFIDGKHVGQHAIGGYTPFHFDITNHVVPNEVHEVTLKLDNRINENVPPDGFKADFIRFGGLYRDVYLVVKDALHIPFSWEAREAGVMITTPSVTKDNSTVLVRTTLRNSGREAQDCRLKTHLIDVTGRVLWTKEKRVSVNEGSDLTLLQSGIIQGEHHHLWSLDDPYLYRVRTEIHRDGELLEYQENPLGLRWFELRSGVGFCLNGEAMELIGVNRHQQYPFIGDAVPNNLHRLDAIKMKEAGINLVRLAHYPHDDAFLEACDELGLLVAEEPPTWIHIGSKLWMDRLEEATRRMVRNHRNHPSVWGWGGGINHRGPIERLHLACKEEDPSRITMNNGTLWTGPQNSGVTDLYAVMDYRGAVVPEGEFLFGMEHSGSHNVIRQQRLISKYKADPQRIGLTAWSGHDNFSFVKRGKKRPNLSVWKAALWDVFRQPKPAFYWYQSELKDEPMVHIPDGRAQKNGELRIFSNCDEVELFVDGVLADKKKRFVGERTQHLKSPPYVFPLENDGNVEVRGYRGGKVVAEAFRAQTEVAERLIVNIDESGYSGEADGSSILIVTADIVDKNGVRVRNVSGQMNFSLTGPGAMIEADHIDANPAEVNRGRAVAFFRVDSQAGEIRIKAHQKGLEDGEDVLVTKPWSSDVLTRSARPVRNMVHVKADVGNDKQHVQDGWSAWIKEDFLLDGLSFSITSTDPEAEQTNSYGVPGELSHMIEDGIEFSPEHTLTLKIRDLRKGKYRLRTWHHRLTGKRSEAPALEFKTNVSGAQLPQNYFPSFGKKIRVSEAGGGNAGDGGSNLGAQGYAETLFESDGGDFSLTVSSRGGEGKVALNGIELLEL